MINAIENNLKIIHQTPVIDSRYFTAGERDKNIVILGSSKSSKELEKYLKACSDITRYFVENGYNIVHGCGSSGIMGEAYKTAQKYSAKDLKNGKPIQNLAIVTEKLWGDENLKDCVLIGKAKSEAERIEKFAKISDKFVIFPGGATTIQEASTLVQHNAYDTPKKGIVLFGQDFWKGFENIFEKIAEFNLIKKEQLNKIFHIADNKTDVIKFLLKK